MASGTDCWGNIDWDVGPLRNGKGSNRNWNLLLDINCKFPCCWNGTVAVHLLYLWVHYWALRSSIFKLKEHHFPLMHLPEEKIHKKCMKYVCHWWNQASNREKYSLLPLFLRMLDLKIVNGPICVTLFISFSYNSHYQSVLPPKIQHCRKTRTAMSMLD